MINALNPVRSAGVFFFVKKHTLIGCASFLHLVFFLKQLGSAAFFPEFLAPCIKRMRVRACFYLNDRICFSILPLYCLIRCLSWSTQEAITAVYVHKYNFMWGWVNTFFQCQNSLHYQNVIITFYNYILLPLWQLVKKQAFLVRKNNLKMVANNKQHEKEKR